MLGGPQEWGRQGSSSSSSGNVRDKQRETELAQSGKDRVYVKGYRYLAGTEKSPGGAERIFSAEDDGESY